jgi:hypothetical protein
VIAHAPPLAHSPVFPQGGAAVQAMSAAPTARLVHAPTVPGKLQDLQAPPQALLQHTPSMQFPVAQSLPAAHTAPFARPLH